MFRQVILSITFISVLGGGIESAPIAGIEVPDWLVDVWQRSYDNLQLAMQAEDKGIEGLSDQSQEMVIDEHSIILSSDVDALSVVLRRSRVLIEDLATMPDSPDLTALGDKLGDIETRAGESGADRHALYLEACLVRREISLSNPLLDFDSILFGQWKRYGKRDRPRIHRLTRGHKGPRGCGLYKVSDIKSTNPTVHSYFDGKTIPSGTYAGASLSDGKMAGLDLSYDGEEVLFGWCEGSGTDMGEVNSTFHIFRMNTDGTELTQLTDTKEWSEYQPFYMPNGRIGYITTVRNGGNRCGPFVYTATLASMAADGSDRIQLSWHETNELHPSIDNDGRIVYTRWDYIDREANYFHNIWICNIDGTDPRAPHGNYPTPLYVRQTKEEDCNKGRRNRPIAEHTIRAIPGSNTKYVAIASNHFSDVNGFPIMIDVSIPDDNRTSQVKSYLPACGPYSNKWGKGYSNRQPEMTEMCTHFPVYMHPWPLSEDYMLISKGLTHEELFAIDGGIRERIAHEELPGIYLLDKFGNEEPLFVGIEYIRTIIPLKERTVPPAQPIRTYQGERAGSDGHYRATISVTNVYESDFEWPEDTKITGLRIIQVIPRPSNAKTSISGNEDGSGYMQGGLARVVLGTVPVEEDGSTYFEAPIKRQIYFQAVDSLGTAIMSMRSGTYVHPGENLSCLGCHEDKWSSTPPPSGTPQAMSRPPSPITPDVDGSNPLTFARLVYPVIRDKCNKCHEEKDKGIVFNDATSKDCYWDEQLRSRAFWYDGMSGDICTPKHGGSRTPPGGFGARGCELGKTLIASHRDRLTDEEFHRVTLWLDANSLELCSYIKVDEQRNGEVVRPQLDYDPDNPQGVEIDRPVPSGCIGCVATSLSSAAIERWGTGNSASFRGNTIHVRLTKGQSGILQILDSRGRIAKSLRMTETGETILLKTTDLNLSQGIYHCMLKTGSGIQSIRLPILRQ